MQAEGSGRQRCGLEKVEPADQELQQFPGTRSVREHYT